MFQYIASESIGNTENDGTTKWNWIRWCHSTRISISFPIIYYQLWRDAVRIMDEFEICRCVDMFNRIFALDTIQSKRNELRLRCKHISLGMMHDSSAIINRCWIGRKSGIGRMTQFGKKNSKCCLRTTHENCPSLISAHFEEWRRYCLLVVKC